MALKPEIRRDRIVLNNGLVVLVSENPKLPLVSLNAYVLAGLDQNPMDRNGLASLTARMLDEGTEKFDYRTIAEILEGSGGCLSIFSVREVSGINMQIKAEDVEQSLDLLFQMICRPIFPPDRFESEKQKVLNHLRSMEDDPQTVAGNRFNRLIYQDTPLEYPVLGTPAGLEQLDTSQLAEFHRQKYGPSSTVLAIAGDISTEAISERLEETFGRWTNPDCSRIVLPPLKRQSQPIYDAFHLDKEQLHMLVGHLGIERSNPDFAPLQVLDVVLGSGPGFTSRIPRKLRDEQGLAYTTYSDITGSSGLYPGRFTAYICTSPENGERALNGLLREIADVVENGITDEELETAQDYLTGSFVFDIQSNQSVARFLFSIEAFGLGEDYLQRYPEMIRRVDRRQVGRVARSYLDLVNYTTVVVGPV
jgi:zinc protease